MRLSNDAHGARSMAAGRPSPLCFSPCAISFRAQLGAWVLRLLALPPPAGEHSFWTPGHGRKLLRGIRKSASCLGGRDLPLPRAPVTSAVRPEPGQPLLYVRQSCWITHHADS